MSRILVALSGGVDSAVAALLLQRQGHEVHAAYMRTWMNEEGVPLPGECPWEDDVANARGVCEALGIPLRVLNLVKDYREHVVEYLVEGYRRGLTPNPDIVCNREMKFGVFLRAAMAEGFDFMATGHYARRRDNPDGRVDILSGLDPNKDQSYFLALLRQEQACRSLFPIGALRKGEVRAIAREAGLPNAARKDSQGICFLGKVPINQFLALYIPDNPGPIVNTAGKLLGCHRGLHRHTIGQRKGLDVPSNADHEHYVVVAKEFDTNTLRVAFDHPGTPGLYVDRATVHNLSWVNAPVATECELPVRVRYRDNPMRAHFKPDGLGSAQIHFHEPQRGIAPGQILALYDGETLLGGGVFL
ncbi:MAG: tRNA 2-thiouridine(34) synthase MnmA [Puniceicoccales bacterium]|jgi:tRNA-specific 2-thiouridylase|nr:tRNA 2-thiouridine(34) synthase MnmA [Puniceicoccales bacterium]